MAILTWHDQYLIGHSTIDEEHKMLFRLINDFHTGWSENRDRAAVAKLLNQLIQYGEMHFQHEEGIMSSEGYPQLENHQKVHEKLVEEIFKLNQELVDKSQLLERDMGKFLKQWLVDHIVHNDFEFRSFLERKRREDAAQSAASAEEKAENKGKSDAAAS